MQITAWTDGWAKSVRAVLPGQSTPLSLTPSRTPPYRREENDWFAEFRVPGYLAPGLKIIPVIADYGGVTRTVELQLEVIGMTISAMLIPNPSFPGGSVQLLVETDPAASQVMAIWPWGNAELDRLDGHGQKWEDRQQIPEDHPPGTWPVIIRAVDLAGMEYLHRIELMIDQDPRVNVYFHLSD